MRHRARLVGFLGPWLIGLVLFTVLPLVFVIAWSFTRYDLVSPPEFVGLANYRFVVDSDPFVREAARNTLWIVLVGVPLQLVVSLAVASALTRPSRATRAVRTVVVLPSIIPPVAATLAFVWLLEPVHGPVNQLLGGLHLPEPLWFHDPQWSKPGLVLLTLWGVGPTVILFLAGLVRLPEALFEVAVLEGATRWQRFRYVTLPLLAPVLRFGLVIALVNALQYFTQAYVAASATVGSGNGLTGSPRGSTRLYATWLYDQGLHQLRLGYGATLATLLLIASAAVVVVALVGTRRGLRAQVLT